MKSKTEKLKIIKRNIKLPEHKREFIIALTGHAIKQKTFLKSQLKHRVAIIDKITGHNQYFVFVNNKLALKISKSNKT